MQAKKTVLFYLVLLLVLSINSCRTGKRLSKAQQPRYQKMIENSSIFAKGFTGFALFDPLQKKMLYQHQADKYFTPASNAKLFTFYAAHQILGDSIPTIRYCLRGDSLLFWGTANPSFLHPDLPEDNRLLHFLKNSKAKLFYCPGNFRDERFGPGWAWDDYPYAYQCERSAFPIHANSLRIQTDSLSEQVVIQPHYFKQFIHQHPAPDNRLRIRRQQFNNTIDYQGHIKPSKPRDIPFHYSDTLLIQLLSHLLNRPVGLQHELLFPPPDAQSVYQTSTDTLYRKMLQGSDNFIAEQLLLAAAQKLTDTIQVRKTIRHTLNQLNSILPDPPRWVDGSGLSRYNLMTPRSLVALLHQLYQGIPTDRLLSYFPAGGESGTIKDWYKADTPFVFAKTGTLSGKHCLSGYLRNKAGRVLIFSFMHNNYRGRSTDYKKEMDRILRVIALESID